MTVERREMRPNRRRRMPSWRTRTGVVALLTLGANSGCGQPMLRHYLGPGRVAQSLGLFEDPVPGRLAAWDEPGASGEARPAAVLEGSPVSGDRSLSGAVVVSATPDPVSKPAARSRRGLPVEGVDSLFYVPTAWQWSRPPVPTSPFRGGDRLLVLNSLSPRYPTAAVAAASISTAGAVALADRKTATSTGSVSDLDRGTFARAETSPAPTALTPTGDPLLVASRDARIALPKTLADEAAIPAGGRPPVDDLLSACNASKIAPPLRRVVGDGVTAPGPMQSLLDACRASKIAPPLRSVVASSGTPSGPIDSLLDAYRLTKIAPPKLRSDSLVAARDHAPAAVVVAAVAAATPTSEATTIPVAAPVETPSPTPDPPVAPEPVEVPNTEAVETVVVPKPEPKPTPAPADEPAASAPPVPEPSPAPTPASAPEVVAAAPPPTPAPSPSPAPASLSVAVAAPPDPSPAPTPEVVVEDAHEVAASGESAPSIPALWPVPEPPNPLPTLTPEVSPDPLGEASAESGIALPKRPEADAPVDAPEPASLPAIPKVSTDPVPAPALDEVTVTEGLLEARALEAASRETQIPLPVRPGASFDPALVEASRETQIPLPTRPDGPSKVETIAAPEDLIDAALEAACRATRIMPPTPAGTRR